MTGVRPGLAPLGPRLVEAVFDAGFTFVTGVPDTGISQLTTELDRGHFGVAYVPGTREDNSVALAVGAHLAGARALVLMKSAGFGTAVDALTSLAKVYRVPVVVLVSWAGYAGRDIPHHNVIGEVLEPLVDALGLPTRQARLDDVDGLAVALRGALAAAEEQRLPAVVLGVPEGL